MTNSARRNAETGNAEKGNAMTIAAENRRPAWFRWVAGLPVVVALLFTSIPAADAQGRANAPDSFADLAQKLLPAVVNISTTQNIPERRGAGPR